MIVRQCVVQASGYDLQAKMNPTICPHHNLHNNNENKKQFSRVIYEARQNSTQSIGIMAPIHPPLEFTPRLWPKSKIGAVWFSQSGAKMCKINRPWPKPNQFWWGSDTSACRISGHSSHAFSRKCQIADHPFHAFSRKCPETSLDGQVYRWKHIC